MTPGTVQGAVGTLQGPDQVVVENRSFPGNGFESVTDFTTGGKSRRLVLRVLGLVVILKVAGHTLTRGSGVNTILMAAGAGCSQVAALQWKSGMSEIGLIPGDTVVT
jgi:hypothetical protein